MSKPFRPARWWRTADRVGAIASFLCAVHCAVLPFVLAALPLLGLEFLAGHAFERGFVLFAVLLASVVLGNGWRRHRQAVPLWLAVPGLLLLLAGIAVDLNREVLAHTVMVVSGGLLVASAHAVNLYLVHHRSGHAPAHEAHAAA